MCPVQYPLEHIECCFRAYGLSSLTINQSRYNKHLHRLTKDNKVYCRTTGCYLGQFVPDKDSATPAKSPAELKAGEDQSVKSEKSDIPKSSLFAKDNMTNSSSSSVFWKPKFVKRFDVRCESASMFWKFDLVLNTGEGDFPLYGNSGLETLIHFLLDEDIVDLRDLRRFLLDEDGKPIDDNLFKMVCREIQSSIVPDNKFNLESSSGNADDNLRHSERQLKTKISLNSQWSQLDLETYDPQYKNKINKYKNLAGGDAQKLRQVSEWEKKCDYMKSRIESPGESIEKTVVKSNSQSKTPVRSIGF